jgi:hypothetical protein
MSNAVILIARGYSEEIAENRLFGGLVHPNIVEFGKIRMQVAPWPVAAIPHGKSARSRLAIRAATVISHPALEVVRWPALTPISGPKLRRPRDPR